MADNDSSRQIPERWKLVIKEQQDGSCISYYTCPETGQKFSTYEDLMRYVNYAKAAKLSIYSPDFCPRNTPRGPKKKASESVEEQTEGTSDSDDSTFKLPSIASLELPEVASPTPSDQQSSSGQMKTKNRPANEGCSSGSNKGKGKKQKM